MKYIAVFIAALFIVGGCSSSNKKSDADKAAMTTETGAIVDEEFDLLVAPEYDYESDVPYADQIQNKPAADKTKTSKKPAAIKK